MSSTPYRYRVPAAVRLVARERLPGLASEIRKIIRQPPEALDLSPRLAPKRAMMAVRLDEHTASLLHALAESVGQRPSTVLAHITEHLVKEYMHP